MGQRQMAVEKMQDCITRPLPLQHQPTLPESTLTAGRTDRNRRTQKRLQRYLEQMKRTCYTYNSNSINLSLYFIHT